MSIAIAVDGAFDIETYDGLLAFMEEYLELDAETVAQLPALVRMAEYRLNRMLTVPERETIIGLDLTADVGFVALPTGFRQARSIWLGSEYALAPVSLNALSGWAESSGKPQVYTIRNQSVYVGPIPDAAYSLSLTYLAKLAFLSSANQTNWLLTDHADAYVYAVALQCEAFLANDERIPLFEAALVQTMAEINAAGNRYRLAGPIRLRSPVVV